jgi:putative toxin-antitoxin system antitoxin component (TIGR02293 family)
MQAARSRGKHLDRPPLSPPSIAEIETVAASTKLSARQIHETIGGKARRDSVGNIVKRVRAASWACGVLRDKIGKSHTRRSAMASGLAPGSHPAQSYPAAEALSYARQHDVEQWFYDNVVHRRTLKDRLDGHQPLATREADRFDRLVLLLQRATEVFGDEAKALRWLKTPKRSLAGATPLDYCAREAGFLAVLAQLDRIDYGIYA